jgi:hypothetical protein
VYNQLLSAQDPGGTGPNNTSTGVAGCVLQYMPSGGSVWVAKFSIAYGSVPTNPFKGHGPSGGDVVIATFTDPLTHVYVLGNGGITDTIF